MKKHTKETPLAVRPQRHARQVEPTLRFSPIALACTSLLIASGAAFAQDSANLDTVTVTGIRRSIETSIATKRNSDSIVEAVSAEDIGKLPESSIADSLARLPGVTGQRGPDGRTNVISIRGLGPGFSGSLLNGREVVSSNDSRAVEYDQFPSELINSALVYKTPDAALVGQGLSGTVDIKTVKPLDFKGRQIAASLKGETNSNNTPVAGGGSTTGKRFSFSYIDQFADNTIGLALGYAHLDSPTQTVNYRATAYSDPYGPNPFSCGDSWCPRPNGLPKAAQGGGYAAHPMRFEVAAETKSNVRDGFMGTLEFKPNKDLHSQVDLYYSQFDAKSVSTKFLAELYAGVWNGDPNQKPIWSNVKTEQAGGNTLVVGGRMDQIIHGVVNTDTDRKDKISALGWNTSYKLNKDWTAVADISYSRDTRDEKFYENYVGPYANGGFTVGSFNFTAPGSDPAGKVSISPINGGSLVDPNLMKMGDVFGYVDGARHNLGWAGKIMSPHITDEIKSARFSAKRNLDGIFSDIEFGLNYTERDKLIQKNQFDLYMLKDSAGNFIRTVPSAYLRTPTDLSASGVPAVMTIDVPGMINGGAYKVQETLWGKAANDSSVHEKVTTLYTKLDIDTQLGSIPVRGNVGVQAIQTSQRSTGWIFYGDALSTDLSLLHPLDGGKSYTDVLPSLNLVFDLKNDWIARFGLAKTMARPNMNDMRAGAEAPKLVETAAGSGSGNWQASVAGNPNLDPWRANSVDLSLEKYFGKHSYIAAAIFHKNLLTYVFPAKIRYDFSFVPHDPKIKPITPYADVTVPLNGHGGLVEGLELSGSLEGKLLSPMLDGFGVAFSGTATRSSIHTADDITQPLEGLSGNTTNLTVFYEKNGFSARVNQTYRSPFLALSRDLFLNQELTRTAAEKLLNVQLGYAFESGPYKGLSFVLQANNITDRPLVTYASVEQQAPDKTTLVPKDIKRFGRQLAFGVSYKY